MPTPTDEQLREKLQWIAEESCAGIYVIPFWALSYEPGNDMTILRGDSGQVDTLMLSLAGVVPTPPPHDATLSQKYPRGRNLVGRTYRTTLFNGESEQALTARVDEFRRGVDLYPKLGFTGMTQVPADNFAEFVWGHSGVSFPAGRIDNFPTGDSDTPVAYFANGELTVWLVEPQGGRRPAPPGS